MLLRLACLLSAFLVWAQSLAKKQPDFIELLEKIYAQQVQEVSYEILQERLWECYHDPIVLNQASREALRTLCILTDAQLDQFFKHLEKNGPLLSIYELQAIPEFELTTIYQLIPFVKVVEIDDDHHTLPMWKREMVDRHSYWLTRYDRTLEINKNYQPCSKDGTVAYAGSPDKILTRVSIKHRKNFELGFSAQKGAGEAFTWDPTTRRYGFDLWRGHFLLKNRKILKALMVGDYAIGYGQGLIVNAGFSMNKSSETMQVIRTNNLGVLRHTSLANAAFRGIASTWQWHQLECTTYYSSMHLDAKVHQDPVSGNAFVQSLQRSGYYRTQGEIDKKGKIHEQVLGSTLVYKGNTRGTGVGIHALYNHYSLPIFPDTKQGNPFRFCGKDNTNVGLFYRYVWQNVHFFGEGALSKSGGKGLIGGLVASLSAYWDMSLLLRHYDKNFHSPYGKAFRENSSSNSNERGIYVGTRVCPIRQLQLAAYYDYFQLLWFLGRPATGDSWLAKITYQPNSANLVYGQCKETAKEHALPKKEASSKASAVGKKRNYKLRWQHTVSKAIRLNSEVQWSHYQQLGATTRGYAVVQDAAYKMQQLTFSGRIAWFNTDNAINKLVFYEPNVLYGGFNFPAYQGKGMRYCLLVRYQPMPVFRLALKYACTWYRDMDEKKSKPKGRKIQNEVRLQAIVHF